ncbi:MAG: hypothetical protein CBC73_00195, partial [Flavobacteriales bacterium TMED113]
IVLDWIGNWEGDPGSGWSVAGVSNGTKDHTLVRKCDINQGNTDWNISAGTNEVDSEWIVLSQNDWTFLGSHELECSEPEAICTSFTGIEIFEVGDWINPEDTCDFGFCNSDGTFSGTIIDCMEDMGMPCEGGEWVLFEGDCCSTCVVSGCTDSEACNYNPIATLDDGTCGIIDDCGDCQIPYCYVVGGNVNYTSQSDCPGGELGNENVTLVDGIWVGNDSSDQYWLGSSWNPYWNQNCSSSPGCMDQNACNYWYAATEDDGSCVFANEGYDCDGNCLTDLDNCGVCNGDNSTCLGSQNIELLSGWNLWSTYINTGEEDIQSIFNEIVDDLVIVKDESGSVYWPQFALNTIGSLTIGEGYQVKMSALNTLVIEGDLVPFDYSIELDEGWGIIGYLHQDCFDAGDMMNPIVNDLSILKDQNGSVYWPSFGLNSIGNMCPGEGYQIKMSTATLFNYPISGGQRIGDIYTERPIHFDEPVNTGSNMIIGFPLYAWQSTLSIGDEIAAYDEKGRLIGSTVYEGNNLALTVWGDDMTTDTKDGLVEGEKIIFRLWNTLTSAEQVLNIKWQEGSEIYSTDAISVAGQIILGNELGADRQLVKITDVLGKEVNGNEKDVMLLYIYDDGSIERIFINE